MGGLLTFKVGNFDTTAEREQFRFFCEQLKAHYEDSNEFCVFAGNYNIGCELDALFIMAKLLPMKTENGLAMEKPSREAQEKQPSNKHE